ncbi:MAG TPA: NAD(P)-dependent oxidoreductase [Acetobacteraceae bacterium]
MSSTVVITGASGNIGTKLRGHFGALGWQLRLLDAAPAPAVTMADLSRYDESWAGQFAGADAVIHLAGDPSPRASWASVQRLNIDMTLNVVRAAQAHGARRVVFASSNWVMAGYRFGSERLTAGLPPHPLNPYGVSKLMGERIGQAAAAEGLSFIAFRIGWCQRGENRPGPHMSQGRWGQEMWVSDRDICQAMERAVLAEGIGFAVLNLMSDNPGMRWDIDATRQAIGYAPRDGHTAVTTPQILRDEAIAARSRALAADLETQVMESGW